MDNVLKSFLLDFETNGVSSPDTLESVEKHLESALPEDYKAFMLSSDGGEGFVGGQYLVVWRAEELIEFNGDYGALQFAPGLFLFGSNGGGEAFAFDMREGLMNIVVVPMIGMELESAIPVAPDFNSFIARIAEKDGLFG